MFGKPTSTPPPEAAAPARRFTDATAPSRTVIGPQTRVRGEVSGEDSIDVAGTLEGNTSTAGVCWVRPGARVAGDVAARSVVVEGELSGTALTAEKVEIGSGARVSTGIRARVVAMAEGAVFDGEIHMDGQGGGATVAFKEKRRPRRDEDEATPGK